MGGSGGSRSEVTPTAAQIPPELQPLVNQAVAGVTDAMGDFDFGQFTQANPQFIAGLTDDELAWLDAIKTFVGSDFGAPAEEGMGYTRRAAGLQPYQHEGAGFARRGSQYGYDAADAGSGMIREGAALSEGEDWAMRALRGMLGRGGAGSAAGPIGSERVSADDVGVDTDTRQMLRAEDLYEGLTGGEVGSSPATLEAMKAWEAYTRPEIQASLALTGNLGGGAVEEAFARGKTEALVPLLMKEIESRQRAASELGQLGLGVSGQELQADIADAELGLRAGEGNATRALQASQANQQAEMENARLALQWAGLDAETAAQVAAIAAGAQGRRMQGGQAIGQLGLAAGDMGLRAGGLLADIGARGAAQDLAAGGQMAAIGSEKARLTMDMYAKGLEAAGLPREVANQQAQALYNDFLRRQALAEGMYLGPTGNFLAGALTPGSITQTRQTGGGLFGT